MTGNLRCLLIFLLFCIPGPAWSQDSVFLFAYFKGNGEDGLHLAWSEDGRRFRALKKNRSFLRPEAGEDKLMRDPCIIRGKDGRFHMVWTVSWEEKGIGYASSEDLLKWSEQQYLPVMEHEAGARNSWAPELTYDPASGQYMIYWASTIPGRFPDTDSAGDDGYNHRIYYTLTPDFMRFSETRLLYDAGFNVIDAHIHFHAGKYLMFLKDETRHPPEKNIRIAHASRIAGPYSPPGPPVTGDYWAEGPTAILSGGQWLLYFDKYVEKQMGLLRSADLERWEEIPVRFPRGARHGSVLKISRQELIRLQNAERHPGTS